VQARSAVPSAVKSSRHAPPCRPPSKGAGTLRRAVRRQAFARILGGRHMECAYYFGWTAHGMCLLLWVDGTWNVPTTLGDGTWNVPTTLTFVRATLVDFFGAVIQSRRCATRLVRSYKRNIGKVAFFERNQCLRSKGHSVAWCLASSSDDSILHVKVGKLIQKRQCLHCVLPNSCEIIDVRFVSASGMPRIRLVQT